MGNSAELEVQSVQPRWDGFGVRLGRAIDRWPGGGQKAFATALEKHAEREGVKIPTSYRTLVNYLQGRTRPSLAWVEAAAAVLRWRADNLLTGEGPEREDQPTAGLALQVRGAAGPRTSTLMHLFVNQASDLPMPARLMVLSFLDDYFGPDTEGWAKSDWPRRRPQITEAVDSFFGPLMARPTMDHNATMALAASLTAAAYIRLGGENGEA